MPQRGPAVGQGHCPSRQARTSSRNSRNKIVLDGGKILRVFEYADPATYAMLVGLPIAGRA